MTKFPEIAEMMKDWRRERGIPVAAWAETIGVSAPSVYAYEAGRRRPGTVETLAGLARVLQLDQMIELLDALEVLRIDPPPSEQEEVL